jgi:phosphoglycolate phosphatase
VTRLLLFDVDGTLVSARGAGRRAMGRALAEVYGTAGPVEGYDFRGKTDPQIVRDLMGAAGFAPAEVAARLDRFYARYLAALAEEVGRGGVHVFPGVAEVVLRLAGEPGVLLGLVTGNIEAGARIKLAPTALLAHFRVGAYGSDAPERARLPGLAARRAARLAGAPLRPEQVVVVGDTPLDIACARAYGARAVAVATGGHAADELARHRPDALFADFQDVGAVLAVLLDGGPGR